MSKFKEELEQYMDAGLPLIYVDTLDYGAVMKTIQVSADRARRGLIIWDQRRMRDLQDNINVEEKESIDSAIDTLLTDHSNLKNKLVVIEDVHFFLNKPEVISRLREIANDINEGKIEDCTIILLAPLGDIPKELENYMTILVPEYPTEQEIKDMILDKIEENDARPPEKVLLDRMIMILKGLSETAIDTILSLALADDGSLDASDLPMIMEQKQQMVKKSGILEIVNVKNSMDDIGGLEILKDWLMRKAEIFGNYTTAKEFGVEAPKGVLIAGMPGCGKSLTAEAAANAFHVPLLRMDMGRLMGKYVGESESNMRRAIQLTEASEPCVLWIDELEKAFAGIGGGGSEVTTRLFGTFLTWMQEKKSMVFVIATANKIQQLPPELLRKGRFDEIFYVELPNKTERKKIFEIHIKKRRPQDLQAISKDMNELVEKTEGYCGADIEGVVREAIETAFVKKEDTMSSSDIKEAIKNTNSLSDIMGDDLDKMKKSYEERKFKKASR